MEKENFKTELTNQLKQIQINITEKQIEEFYKYMELLISWNEKINLTAITDPDEVIKKHFVDSLTINKYISKESKIIDVGTGAGFPGIPLKILNSDSEITLLDSLNKRLVYLNEVIKELNLEKIQTIHSRAEQAGQNPQYREKFDVSVSRAVAPLNILVEYLLPLTKIGGRCICMKGSNVKEEIQISKKAIEILGGKIEEIEEFNLPNSDIGRTIVIIRKIKKTQAKYPRKAGLPSKEPLGHK